MKEFENKLFDVYSNNHIDVYFVKNDDKFDDYENFIIINKIDSLVSNMISKKINTKLIKNNINEDCSYDELILFVDFVND